MYCTVSTVKEAAFSVAGPTLQKWMPIARIIIILRHHLLIALINHLSSLVYSSHIVRAEIRVRPNDSQYLRLLAGYPASLGPLLPSLSPSLSPPSLHPRRGGGKKNVSIFLPVHEISRTLIFWHPKKNHGTPLGWVKFFCWEWVPYLPEYVCRIWLRSDGRV